MIAAGKFTASVPCCRHGLEILALKLFRQPLPKACQAPEHAVVQLGQVNQGKGGLRPGIRAGRSHGEIVKDLPAKFQGIGRRVVVQKLQPVGIVPAGARLGFLAGDHVIRIGFHGDRGLQSRHQAGVEADKIKLQSALLQCGGNLAHIHGIVRIYLVVSVSADRSAAVIPEDQHVAVCGSRLLRVLDKVGQSLLVGHRLGLHGIVQLKPPARQLPALQLARGDNAVSPSSAAACLDQDIDPAVIDLRVKHFVEVGGRHAVLALQVRSDHIDHQRDSVPALAFQFRILGPRAFRHGIIDLRVVRICSFCPDSGK